MAVLSVMEKARGVHTCALRAISISLKALGLTNVRAIEDTIVELPLALSLITVS
jgi:hypothetical protein